MAREEELSPEHRSLLQVSRVVYRKMEEEGALDAHRVPEFVDSLLESTARRFPDAMGDPERLAGMRKNVVEVVTQAIANNTGSPN